jgi:ribose transport system permease protein
VSPISDQQQAPAGEPRLSSPGSPAPSATAQQGRSWIARSEALALPVAFVLVMVGFSAGEPGRFFTLADISNTLGSQTVLFALTMAVLLPLINGDFDLSLGSVSALASMVAALLNADHGVGAVEACLAGLAVAIAAGLLNFALVVLFDTDSFIVTLGTGTAYAGLVYALSGSQTITGIGTGITGPIFVDEFLGIPLDFYYAVVIMLIIWYVQSRTPYGQRALFVGQSREVALLSGIKVTQTRMVAFIVAGALAGISGIFWIGTTGSADPTSASSLLLPAFAAAFLGSTSIKPGRFNALGATIAVLFLGFGVAGLQILGVPDYVQQLFYGAALVVAVVASRLLRKRATSM